MPKPRQRTLFEFAAESSSPAKASRPRNRQLDLSIESDGSDSDPARIKFESDVSASHGHSSQNIRKEGDEPSPSYSVHDQEARSGTSISINSSRFTSPESVEVVSRKRGRRLSGTKRKLAITSDDSDNETSMKKRRLSKGKKNNVSSEEEEEDLINEVDEGRIIESRFRTRSKKTDFVRNLERLQRRRRGEISSSEDNQSWNDSHSADSASTSSLFEGAHPTVNEEAGGVEHISSDEDDDFIIDDDNGGELPELPAIFNMNTYQDLSHHFKVICQFFVHLAVKTPHQRHTFVEQETKRDYFSIPLAIARRKLSSMKDSLVTSSTWKSEFKVPLESFPNFRLERLEFSVPICDACRMGNRVATLSGVVRGLRYDRQTFEPLGDPADDDYDEQTGEIEWNLGRFCAARAQVYHLFSHWEYMLYHSLHREVRHFQEALTSSGAKRMRAISELGRPNDPSDADGIMDWLDGRGVISLQWANIKTMMDRARKLDGGKDEVLEDLDIAENVRILW